MKYPGWTAKSSELKRELEKTVAHLAEVERNVRLLSFQVNRSSLLTQTNRQNRHIYVRAYISKVRRHRLENVFKQAA